MKRDFEKARKLNAKIFINGDVFDMIMHGDRKRYTVGGDKYNSDNNINLLENGFHFWFDLVVFEM